MLASRSFVFHSIATVSRQWEHRRLDLLWRLRRGELPCLVATVEALQQRTLPPQVLDSACTVLEPGQQADLNRLTEALTAAGYVRCDQVEGAGQFALRGGILDVYSPGMAAPVRAEFWGDELDTMGTFDPATQRRTENVDRAVLLPAAETLPQLSPGGLSGLLERLDQLSAKARRDGNEDLAVTLQQDRDALGEGRSFPAADRYLPLIYPEMATAADFLPLDACVLFSESSRVGERAKTYQWQLEEDVKTLLERGELDGSCGELCLALRPAVPPCWRICLSPIWTPSPCPPTRRPPSASCPSWPSSCPPSGPAWRRRCRTCPTTRARASPCWCWCPASSGP